MTTWSATPWSGHSWLLFLASVCLTLVVLAALIAFVVRLLRADLKTLSDRRLNGPTIDCSAPVSSAPGFEVKQSPDRQIEKEKSPEPTETRT